MSRSTNSRRVKTRASYLTKQPNCSLVQIHDNEVYLFNHKIYNTIGNFIIDYAEDRALIFVSNGIESSLNQDPAAPLDETKAILQVPLNIFIEVIKAFEEVQLENIRRVNKL